MSTPLFRCSFAPVARTALAAPAQMRIMSLHMSAAAHAPASGASGSQGGPDHGDAEYTAPWLDGGVPLGAHTPSDASVYSVSGLYAPSYAQRLRQDDAEDWAFGGGAKSKSGRAEPAPDDPQEVFTVDGASLWDHAGHIHTGTTREAPLSAHTYSGPTGGRSISPFDPTPGVARTTPWGTPAPMESESDILGQRRAEKQNRPNNATGK